MIQQVIVYFVGFWFWLWSIVDVLTAGPTRLRFGKKGAWLALVVLLPALGGILYLVFGRYVPEPPPGNRTAFPSEATGEEPTATDESDDEK